MKAKQAKQAAEDATKKRTLSIAADTKLADTVLSKLQALRIRDKKMGVDADTDPAVKSLQKLAAMVLKDKTQGVNADTDPAVLALLKLMGIKLPDKTVKANTDDGAAITKLEDLNARRIGDKKFSIFGDDQATPKIDALKGALDSIQDKHVTLTVDASGGKMTINSDRVRSPRPLALRALPLAAGFPGRVRVRLIRSRRCCLMASSLFGRRRFRRIYGLLQADQSIGECRVSPRAVWR